MPKKLVINVSTLLNNAYLLKTISKTKNMELKKTDDDNGKLASEIRIAANNIICSNRVHFILNIALTPVYDIHNCWHYFAID